MLNIRCDACGRRYRAPDEFAGKKIRCKTCGKVIAILPGGSPIPASAPSKSGSAGPAGLLPGAGEHQFQAVHATDPTASPVAACAKNPSSLRENSRAHDRSPQDRISPTEAFNERNAQPAAGVRRRRALLLISSVFLIASAAAAYWLAFLPWSERVAERERADALQRREAAWKAAREKDTPAAYEELLSAYADASFVTEAKDRLAEAQAWDAASRQSRIQAHAAFLRAHPNSQKAPLARRRIEELSIRGALDRASGLAPEVKQVLETSAALPRGDLRIGTLPPDQQQAALDVLADAAKLMGRESCNGIEDIRPVGAGIPLPDAAAKAHIESSGSMTQGTHEVKLGSFIRGASGLLSDSMLLGRGEYLLADGEAVRCAFTGRLTVTQSDLGIPMLSTELPGERLIFAMGPQLGGLKLRIPAGAGTIYRFRGVVINFFPQYIIVGDSTEVLCFALLSEGGLVYLCGRGTVLTPKKERIPFPPAES